MTRRQTRLEFRGQRVDAPAKDDLVLAAMAAEQGDAAARLGASQIYLISGGRGQLGWEAAAARFAELIAPCKVLAEARGVSPDRFRYEEDERREAAFEALGF